VAAELWERLSVSKRVAQKFDMQRFDFGKLNDAEIKGTLSGQNYKQVCIFGKL
jgi:hypothetical protein